MTHLKRQDGDLHHDDGSHRTTPASTAGRVLEAFDRRLRKHLAGHRGQQVRYISPFGSPAWMTPDEAQRRLTEDDARWLEFQAVGNLSQEQRQVGPPRIEVP